MRLSINDRLDMILEKLETVKITDEWQPVIDYCKIEELDPEWVLKVIKVTVDVGKTIKVRQEEKERLKNI